MKKIFVLTLLCFLLLTGCGSNTPTARVEAYLDGYNSMKEEVASDMEAKVTSENLSYENQKIYKNVLTRQYENIKYEVKDESINGDKATVTVKITVYDLYKAEKDVINYMNTYPNEFYDENNNFSEEIFNKYRLNQMLSTNETVDYEIYFYLNKVNGEWIIENPERNTLEKIHGIYNYDIQ